MAHASEAELSAALNDAQQEVNDVRRQAHAADEELAAVSAELAAARQEADDVRRQAESVLAATQRQAEEAAGKVSSKPYTSSLSTLWCWWLCSSGTRRLRRIR